MAVAEAPSYTDLPERIAMLNEQIADLQAELSDVRAKLVHLEAQRQQDQHVIAALQERLEDIEDSLDAQAGLREAAKEGTVPWEEVKRELGL